MTNPYQFDDPAMRGYLQMLICECTHKEHGHGFSEEKFTDGCSRCDCKGFKERPYKDKKDKEEL